MRTKLNDLISLILLTATLALFGCGVVPSGVARVTPLPADYAPPTATVTAALARNETTPPETATPRPATPTPLSNNLPAGSAAAIALATDVATKPTVPNPINFTESPVPIQFDEFYSGSSLRGGLILSDKLLSLDGQTITIEGYMAPPLKAELDFFVLTRIRLDFCPFCSTASDWPDDIALVYLPDGSVEATTHPIRLTGQMEIGPLMDQETGMVSVVRIYAQNVEILN